MQPRHPLLLVLLASAVTLAVGFWPTPFWDEDEPRFAAIARAMLDTGDWVVPEYNDALAVDKPVLMHWCMAACFGLFGTSEIAARLPAAAATLLAALALLRAGTRWFSPLAGVLAALAYVGCLLVAVESHAATPDAILTALTTWATVLGAEAWLPGAGAGASAGGRLTIRRAALVGGLMGLAVLCKGPIGFVGPLAVVLPWAWGISLQRRLATPTDRNLGGLVRAACAAVLETLRATRVVTLTLAMLAVAAPWYVAVGVRTAGAWPAGFFLIHNVGRFAAPMEKHGGGLLYHPLGLLVGFYPWSCFLPLAIVLAAWRLRHRSVGRDAAGAFSLALVWLAVWVGGFSAAATKLPNYVMPAYPAAALLVAALAADAAGRAAWPHPGWLASGLGWLAFGGLATSAVVITAGFFGLPGAAPAAVVGIVPVAGAIACLVTVRRGRLAPIAIFAATALVFTALAVGPAGGWLARANTLPAFVGEAHRLAGGRARIGAFGRNSPTIVYYAAGHVQEWRADAAADAGAFLATGPDAVVIVPEPEYAALAAHLPATCGIVGRTRPLFQKHDALLVGTHVLSADRAATSGNLTR
ncbi:MAG: phospholipid carrier-dependent glycosyltransferase [Planctomycetia bacterium]|nr:phospholipid carrier-dependent glycosyltransferase [Planctomycetia bacterium]